jgi:hypothetical protein
MVDEVAFEDGEEAGAAATLVDTGVATGATGVGLIGVGAKGVVETAAAGAAT